MHVTLLHDATWYSDTVEPRSWLIYYISRPLVGSWEEVNIVPAVLPGTGASGPDADVHMNGDNSSSDKAESVMSPRKKDIKSFHELLNHFPAIARQMQPGLEKILREFTAAFERPLPPPPSSTHIPDPEPDGPIVAAMKKARSNSVSASKHLAKGKNGTGTGTS